MFRIMSSIREPHDLTDNIDKFVCADYSTLVSCTSYTSRDRLYPILALSSVSHTFNNGNRVTIFQHSQHLHSQQLHPNLSERQIILLAELASVI